MVLELVTSTGEELNSCVQVAATTRPLWAVGKICDSNYDVLFMNDKAVVVEKGAIKVPQGKVIHEAKRVKDKGLYLSKMRLRNPRYKPKASFPRQGR